MLILLWPLLLFWTSCRHFILVLQRTLFHKDIYNNTFSLLIKLIREWLANENFKFLMYGQVWHLSFMNIFLHEVFRLTCYKFLDFFIWSWTSIDLKNQFDLLSYIPYPKPSSICFKMYETFTFFCFLGIFFQ